MEYIKRTDVMKICEAYSEHCFNSSDSKGQDIADRILDDVVEIPTADVEKVKHAEWVRVADTYGKEYLCSACKGGIRQCIGQPYCSNCGAIMDGGGYWRK